MIKRGHLAISEIFILVLSIFAFGYLLNGEIGIIAAAGHEGSGTIINPDGSISDAATQTASTSPTPVPKVQAPVTTATTGTGATVPGAAAAGTAGAAKPGVFGSLMQNNFMQSLLIGGVIGFMANSYFKGKNAMTAGFVAGTVGTLVFKMLSSQGKTTMQSFVAGAAVGVAIFLFMYKKDKTETVTFECNPWQAPVGGTNCERCNDQGLLHCSEYQCRSLGQACQLVNEEGSPDALCTWVNRQDVDYPTISPWTDPLTTDYKYTPDNAVSPPDRGVKIVYTKSTTGCIKAFTPLQFGIILDEPAQCKIDYARKDKFDDMSFYFGESSTFKYNHTQQLSLPGPNAENSSSPVIENGNDYSLYVRCQDANGNANIATFVFNFCVEEGPDTTPPVIVTTNVLTGMPIAYNQSSMDLEVYVNEPSECKWSHRDQIYDDMEESMTCSRSIFEMNAQMLYKCKTTLTGLKNSVTNDFYFRCKDKPLEVKDRNVNQQSYKFSLIGTQPLVIDEVLPNETVKDSSDPVKVNFSVITSAGYNKGEATCYYSNSGATDSYIEFFETDSYKHSQELYLKEGSYKYYIKCIDLGGNQDDATIEFDVDSDIDAPKVVRVYHEETYLKIVTDEEASCVYDTKSCSYSFEEGVPMVTVEDVNHFTDWNTKTTLYIKCMDGYGNRPLPNACSIISRPFETFNLK